MSADTIESVELVDGSMRVALLSYGAITQGWWLGDTPLILGYEAPADYLTDPFFMGAIVGRVANRISGARFSMNGAEFLLDANEGANCLHSGAMGLARQNWIAEKVSQQEARFSLLSEDGAGGFPGRVVFTVSVKLQAPRLTYTFFAQPDRPTPISLAQHNYYTLGEDTALHLKLKLASDRCLAKRDDGIPTGELNKASGNLDFGTFRRLGDAPELDHFYTFRSPGMDQPIAELRAPSGLGMRVWSDQPGAQVYTGRGLSTPFTKNGGMCIEPSGFPNAPNVASFPSMIFTPDQPYRQVLALEIDEGGA
ncbi:aldose epimerase family protein [Actibacterium pelagium]|uniref:aldose epimerase family protein n=1 Tax=Actibacterium pelagium TaxID=2029103 RepID=UPI0011786E10|nr:aldose epimerase family protein [Actibacterium pelagium]